MQKKIQLGARVILGLIFVVFGANFFFNFIPMPADVPENLKKFSTALFEVGFMFPIIKTIEVVCGFMLLTNFFVPLALLLLAPIIVNIVLIHTFLDRSGAPMAYGILVLTLFLAWTYKGVFKHVLKAKN